MVLPALPLAVLTGRGWGPRLGLALIGSHRLQTQGGSRAHDRDSVRLATGARWLLVDPRSSGKTGAAPKPDTSSLAVPAAPAPRAGELGKAGCGLECGSTHIPRGCGKVGGGGRRGVENREGAGPRVRQLSNLFPAESLAIVTWGSCLSGWPPCKLDLYSP